MKFLKQIFGLNGRLDRRGYLLFGVLPMIGWMFWEYTFALFKIDVVVIILFIPVFILTFISSVKRGRDTGLSNVVALLFVIVLMLLITLGITFQSNFLLIAFLFIAYLQMMPSSSKELKVIGKVEYFIIIMASIIPPIILVLQILETIAETRCSIEKTMIALTCIQMSTIADTLDTFKLDNGFYPTKEEGLSALVSTPNALKLLKDSWDTPIIYVKTKDGFELISYGADRKEGGEDDGADILYSECEGR